MWYPELPTLNHHKPEQSPIIKNKRNKVVYMPSCASRSMGQQSDNDEQRSLTEVTMSLINKAGFEVIIASDLSSQCCGMPYDSKGMSTIAQQKSRQLEATLWYASEQGKWPVLMDTSPCAKRSIEEFTLPIEILEPTGFVEKYLMGHLAISPIDETVMLHVTCSSRLLGLENSMLQLAKACATEVIIPEHIQCRGWAGDKGFTTPELNKEALKTLKEQVPEKCSRGFSNSRTCEIGLSHHSGIPYQSILYLVDEASSANVER
ncbi:(Fe-S)-binding protein [Psychromonas sp. KJ10-10]|uniref:(Fe-S)-binding protein n=1 Tax=Psychromonas sp. KJ10-10 TaxID=3391823 RepID=UPI0039B3F89E